MFFTVSKGERATAEYFLANAADGTKLPYSARNKDGQIEPRKKTKDKFYKLIEKHNHKVAEYNKQHPATPQKTLEHTLHSFIKLDGTIYAIAPEVLGAGSYGSVRLLIDPQNQLFVVKKETSPQRLSKLELQVLVDRKQSTGRHQVHYLHSQDKGAKRSKPTHYTKMDYLGTTITKYLEANPQLSDDQRLEIAILLCSEVHDLHHIRSKSSSKTAFSHRDLKNVNATITIIDGKMQVHLIDFGFVETNPKKFVLNNRGTALYTPYKYNDYSISETLDVFALKRCLFMPENFWHGKGYADNFFQQSENNWLRGILTEQQIQNPILNTYFNTGSSYDERNYYNEDPISAGALAAILIAVRLNLNIPADQLATNQAKALVVTALYQANQDKKAIEAALENDTKVRHIAAFAKVDQYAQMQDFFQDPAFTEAMNQAETYEQACALVFFKSLGISNYAALSDPVIAQAIYFIHEQPKLLWTPENIEKIIDNPILAKMILFLEEQRKQQYLPLVLQSSEFDSAVSQTIQILIKKEINSRTYYEKVLANKSLTKAIAYLEISVSTPQLESNIEKLINSDPKIWEAIQIYGDHTSASARTANFLPHFLWQIRTAEVVVYLSKYPQLLGFINKDIPKFADCINVLTKIKDPTFDSDDVYNLLNNDHAQTAVAELNAEQAHAYIILFKNQINRDFNHGPNTIVAALAITKNPNPVPSEDKPNKEAPPNLPTAQSAIDISEESSAPTFRS